MPTNNGVSLVDNSFAPPLESRQSGNGQETLHWNALIGSLNAQNFSFSAQLQNMQPGEVRQISNGTTVNFATVDDSGTLELPPLFVSAQHVLSIAPASRTAAPGNVAEFALTLENLLGATETFSLEVNGLPVQEPLAPTTLAAGETRTISLRLAIPQDTLIGLNLTLSEQCSDTNLWSWPALPCLLALFTLRHLRQTVPGCHRDREKRLCVDGRW